MIIKVFSEVNREKINYAGKFDCGKSFFAVHVDAENDAHYSALQKVRALFDQKACATQNYDEKFDGQVIVI